MLAEQEERTRSQNLTLQYRNIAYQIRYDGPGYRLQGAKVTVCALANGEVVLLREGRELLDTSYRKGERPPPPAEDEKTLNARVDAALEKQQRQRDKPARDHPWRQAGAMAAARTAPSPAAPPDPARSRAAGVAGQAPAALRAPAILACHAGVPLPSR